MPIKKYGDLLLDIVGWLMVASSGFRIVKEVLFAEELNFKLLIPLGAVLLFGIILIYITLKKAGSQGWSLLKNFAKKKLEDEEINH